MALVQIKDNKNLLRDVYSKAVLNNDKNGLEEYYTKREIAKKQNEEKEETKMRLIKLEEDLNQIKTLLMEISELRGKKCL
jgi:cell shape-determining protein MreC